MKDLLNKVKKLYDLTLLEEKELYKLIDVAEKKGHDDIAEFKKFNEKYPLIYVNLDEGYILTKYVQEELGIYAKCSYKAELKQYTCKMNKWNLYYAIRDNIMDFYTFLNAQIKDKVIVFNSTNKYFLSQSNLIIKKYQNGRMDFKRDETLEEIIKLCKAIHDLYNPKEKKEGI